MANRLILFLLTSCAANTNKQYSESLSDSRPHAPREGIFPHAEREAYFFFHKTLTELVYAEGTQRGEKCMRAENTRVIAFPGSRPARPRPRDAIAWTLAGQIDDEFNPSPVAPHGHSTFIRRGWVNKIERTVVFMLGAALDIFWFFGCDE